jgi:hypothetical protein
VFGGGWQDGGVQRERGPDLGRRAGRIGRDEAVGRTVGSVFAWRRIVGDAALGERAGRLVGRDMALGRRVGRVFGGRW